MKTSKQIGQGISRLSNQIRRRLDTVFAGTDLGGSQGRVLHFILAQNCDLFQKDIEEEFKLRPSSATGILQLMEKNGYIKRVSMPHDARLKKIIPTEKANALKDIVMHDLLQLEIDLKANIKEQDLEMFFQVLDQMSKNLSA